MSSLPNIFPNNSVTISLQVKRRFYQVKIIEDQSDMTFSQEIKELSLCQSICKINNVILCDV